MKTLETLVLCSWVALAAGLNGSAVVAYRFARPDEVPATKAVALAPAPAPAAGSTPKLRFTLKRLRVTRGQKQAVIDLTLSGKADRPVEADVVAAGPSGWRGTAAVRVGPGGAASATLALPPMPPAGATLALSLANVRHAEGEGEMHVELPAERPLLTFASPRREVPSGAGQFEVGVALSYEAQGEVTGVVVAEGQGVARRVAVKVAPGARLGWAAVPLPAALPEGKHVVRLRFADVRDADASGEMELTLTGTVKPPLSLRPLIVSRGRLAEGEEAEVTAELSRAHDQDVFVAVAYSGKGFDRAAELSRAPTSVKIAAGERAARFVVSRKKRDDLPPDGRRVEVTCSLQGGATASAALALTEDDAGRDLVVIVLDTGEALPKARREGLDRFVAENRRRVVGGRALVAGKGGKLAWPGEAVEALTRMRVEDVCSDGFDARAEVVRRTRQRGNAAKTKTFLIWNESRSPADLKDDHGPRGDAKGPPGDEVYLLWAGATKAFDGELEKVFAKVRGKQPAAPAQYVRPNESLYERLRAVLDAKPE